MSRVITSGIDSDLRNFASCIMNVYGEDRKVVSRQPCAVQFGGHCASLYCHETFEPNGYAPTACCTMPQVACANGNQYLKVNYGAGPVPHVTINTSGTNDLSSVHTPKYQFLVTVIVTLKLTLP